MIFISEKTCCRKPVATLRRFSTGPSPPSSPMKTWRAIISKRWKHHWRRQASSLLPSFCPPEKKPRASPHWLILCEQLLAAGVERRDKIIAFGGGVIGDLTGFAAAILRRGVEFIQIPTTLLAQVDSSVGGKTGINSAHGKNLIGAFLQPVKVLADTSLLETLPRRELAAGYAEVAKYGLLGDLSFFEWLEANAELLLRGDAQARAHAIHQSCSAKAAIVAEDETEQGVRALLNLGHTFGHALESATGYSNRLLHGEGVAIGMVQAFRFSERLKHCKPGTADRVARHLKSVGPADPI